jgi:type IV pilus assembly protein PilO
MAKFSDMSPMARIGVIVLVAVLVAAGAYFGFLKAMDDANRVALEALKAKQAENENLRSFEPKLAELERQIGTLQAQMEIQKKIVPDEKEADKFISLVQDTANAAGIEVRSFTTKPIASKEFYTEAPFEMEIDGPYFGVLNFFERVAKLERIINVENLHMGSTKKTGGVVKKVYQYGPGESVVASYVAKTFYSNAAQQQAATAPAAPAQK